MHFVEKMKYTLVAPSFTTHSLLCNCSSKAVRFFSFHTLTRADKALQFTKKYFT